MHITYKEQIDKDLLGTGWWNSLFFLLLLFASYDAEAQCSINVPNGENDSLCGDGAVTLTADASSGFYKWYDAATGGSLVATGDTFITPVLSDTTDYYVAAYDTTSTSDALDFNENDNNDSIYVGDQPNLKITGDMTIEMWVKPDNFSSRKNPYAKAYSGEGTITQEDGDGELTYFYGNDGGNNGSSGCGNDYLGFGSSSTLTTGTWHHIAVVRDMTNGMLYWYIDGGQTNSTAACISPVSGNLPVLIGAGYVDSYDGQIDEVRVWSEARSQSEIQNYKDSCLQGGEANLELYYRMDDGTGSSTLTDHSVNGYDGTLKRMDLTNDWVNTGPTMNKCLECETSDRDTVTAFINPIPSVDLGNDTCVSDQTVLDAGAGFASYLWQNGDNGQTFIATSSGTYHVEVDDGGPCPGYDTIDLNVVKTPVATDDSSCGDASVTLTASGGSDLYKWFDAPTGGSLVSTGDTFNTPVLPDTTKYYVSSFDTVTTTDVLDLDGTDDQVRVGDKPKLNITGDMTIEMWVKPANFSSRKNPYAKAYAGEGTITQEDGGGELTYYYGNNGKNNGSKGCSNEYQAFKSSNTLTTGNWQHIAVVRDLSNGMLYWYIDGVQTNSAAACISPVSGNLPVLIGGGYVDNYDGQIDEVRVWSEARTQTEIQNNMTHCLEGGEADLELYYRMDDGDGNTLTDHSLNGYDGTLENMSPGSDWLESGRNITGCSNCESLRDTAVALIRPVPNTDLGNDTCVSDSLVLDPGVGFNSYSWQDGSTDTSFTAKSSAKYWVEVSDGGVCPGHDSINVTVLETPEAADSSRCGPGSVQLEASGGSGFYRWYDAATGGNLVGTGNIFNTPSLSASQDYYVSAFDTVSTKTAIDLDGNDDSIYVGDKPDLNITGDLTIEMWVKPANFSSRRNPYAKAYAGEGTITQETDGKLNYYYGDDGGNNGPGGCGDNYQSFNSSSSLTAGKWHHIAVVRDMSNGMLYWYIDGVQTNSAATCITPVSGNLPVLIGGGYVDSYDGQIDEVRVWSEARTQTEIQNDKDNCLDGSEPDLELYYRMDDGGGTTLTDHSSNGYDGTLTNMDPASDWVGTGPTMSKCVFCESDRDTATATIDPDPSVDLGNDTCVEDPITLDAGAGHSSYLWHDGSTGQTINANSSRAYWVEVNDGGDCSERDTVFVSFGKAADPVVLDSSRCGNGPVDLTVTGPGDFKWFDQASGGTKLGTGDTFTTPSLSSNKSYYVESFIVEKEALDLDGNDDQIRVGDKANLNITGDMTIEMWVKPDNFSSRKNPYAKAYAGEGTITQETDGKLNYYFGDDGGNNGPGGCGNYQSFNTNSALSAGDWHHIAVVRDMTNNMLYWYIDGAQTNSAATCITPASGNLPVLIGGGYVDNYDGQIDEVRVWSEARTQSDIQDYKDSCLTGTESNLELYYRMQPNGSTAIDDSQNNYDGTLENMDPSTDWVETGPAINCSDCGTSDRIEVTATINSKIASSSHVTACPGVGGSEVEVSATGGSGKYDYREIGGQFPYSGSYQAGAKKYLLPNGGSYSIEVKDENACLDTITLVNTDVTPAVITPSSSAGVCISKGANGWLYILNASDEVIASIHDNGTELGSINANAYVESNAEIYQGEEAYMGRHFKITTGNSPTGDARVRLYFTPSEFSSLKDSANATPTTQDDVVSIADLGVTKYDGPTEDDSLDPSDAISYKFIPQDASGTDIGGNYVEVTVSDFSEFWIHAKKANNKPLPVELLFFDASEKDGDVLTEWATASETNSSHFFIQRSRDPQEGAKRIGRIEAQGQSQTKVNYSFLDEDPLQGVSYYRLIQVDENGRQHPHDWAAVEFQGHGDARDPSVTLFPNPTKEDRFNVKLSGFQLDTDLEVSMVDLSGRDLHLGRVSTGKGETVTRSFELDHDPSPGVYLIRLIGDQQVFHKKLILH